MIVVKKPLSSIKSAPKDCLHDLFELKFYMKNHNAHTKLSYFTQQCHSFFFKYFSPVDVNLLYFRMVVGCAEV